MGRLDDIIARNTNPSAQAREATRARKAAAREASRAQKMSARDVRAQLSGNVRPTDVSRPSGAEPGERLAAIIARNTPRPWYANKLVRGLIFAALVLICLALVAFTNLAKPHVDAKPAAGPAAPADHVDGVYLSPGAKHHK